jgi:hypothetical protein
MHFATLAFSTLGAERPFRSDVSVRSETSMRNQGHGGDITAQRGLTAADNDHNERRSRSKSSRSSRQAQSLLATNGLST